MEWSRSIRVLLAVLVASWSSVLCCCRSAEPLDHALASASHSSAETAYSDSDECSPSQSHGAEPCHHHAPNDDRCGCQRHELRTVQVTPDEAPVLSYLHTLLVTNAEIPTGMIDFDLASAEYRLRRAEPTSRWAVRAESLYERRCLLLI